VVVSDFMKRGPGHNKYQTVKRAKKVRTGSVEMIDDAWICSTGQRETDF
jgi:hypothetical protein